MKPLIAIVGNTGVGKSQFAVELAKLINGEIINGDAMQMYEGLEVMTNKHPVSERDGVPHHFLGTEPWSKQLTVQDFESSAVSLIEQLHARNKVPILVGGTHYYIQSLIAKNAIIKGGQSSTEMKDKSFSSEELEILNDPIRVETTLKEVDPLIASKFHPNDVRRLRRALEMWFETGRRPSDVYEAQTSGDNEQRLKLRYRVLTFWIWCNKAELDVRLDNRVDDMLKLGLLDEVKELNEQKSSTDSLTGIWQVLGYRQFLPYLENPSSETLAQSITAMKAETRAYAKKQTKWIRNKLLPLLQSLGGTYSLLDSTRIRSFEENVTQRGAKLAKEWLNGSAPLSEKRLVPEYLQGETARRRQAFSKSQWVRHRCEPCSLRRNSEVVLVGDDDWQVHLRSKQHRAATTKSRKELFLAKCEK